MYYLSSEVILLDNNDTIIAGYGSIDLGKNGRKEYERFW